MLAGDQVSKLLASVGPTAMARALAGVGPMSTLTPVEIFSLIYSRGADLINADQTIQPFTDRAFFYVLPAGTLTANRIVTFGNTGFYTAAGPVFVAGIIRLDTSAFTLTVRRADATVIYTDPASPPPARTILFTCSTSGVWSPSRVDAFRT